MICNHTVVAGANLFNYVYRSEFGNGKFSTGHGYKYRGRGRGIIQLTWKAHYEEFNDWLKSNGYKGVDVVTYPDLVANDFDLATISAMWFWKKNNMNIIVDNKNIDKYDRNRKITKKVNAKRLGEEKRFEYQESIFKIFNK